MITKFKKLFEEKLNKKDSFHNLQETDKKELVSIFFSNKNENTNYLTSFLEKYKLSKGQEFYKQFYFSCDFIYLLGGKNFTNKNITEILKKELEHELKKNKPSIFAYLLKILFSINKNDNDYYLNLYKKVKNENKIFHDINEEFLEIFINIKENQYFSETFKQIIIDNTEHFYSASIGKGLDYLNSLDKENFKKILFSILEYFSNEKVKKKLIKFHEYLGIFSDKYFKKIDNKVDNLFAKIKKDFDKEDYDNLYSFLYEDIKFALNNYQRDLFKISFLKKLVDFLYQKDSKIILKILKNIIGNKHLFGIEKFAVKYLNLEDVDEFFSILKEGEKEIVIYYTYDIFKREKKEKFVEKFENSKIFGKEILERNKKIEENEKKYKQEEEKIKEKERQEFLNMLNPKERGAFYPRLFQKYLDYKLEQGKLEELFSKKEIKKIEESLQKQIYTCLDYIKIEQYNSKTLKLIHFERTGDSTFTHSAFSQYLELIINISKIGSVKINLEKYYKSIVLFYPLIWGDEIREYILKIIGKKIGEDDIDYILKAYSKDLHDKAQGLKFHQIQNFIEFYRVFKNKFNDTQKKKTEKICLNFIESDSKEVNEYYKDEFLEIHIEIGGEKKLRRLWNKWNKKYPDFNFFYDILKNRNSLDEKQRNDLKTLVNINKHLILNYQDKKAVLWRIKQLKNGMIEGEEDCKIEYPQTRSVSCGVTPISSELGRWGREDKSKFLYVFSKIPKVDIKKEILEILKLSFDIQKDLLSGDLKGKYELYYKYLRGIFFDYVLNLDKDLADKKFYYSIKDLLDNYDYKITYDFNLPLLKEKFGIDDLEEEAREIYKKGVEGVREFLEEKFELENKVINIIPSDSKKIDIDKILNDNSKLKQENQKLKKYRGKFNKIEKENKELIKNKEKLESKVAKLDKELKEIKSITRKEKEIIFFVEGITDKMILENAWKMLYGGKEIPFLIENGYSSSQMRSNFDNENYSFMDSNPNKIFIGMLDFDNAYAHYNKLSNNWEEKNNNEREGLLKKHKKKKGYIFLLPVPLFRGEYASRDIGNNSLLSIELLFENKYILETNRHGHFNYVKELKLAGKFVEPLYKFEKNKMDFAQKTIYFKKEAFKYFIPIFKMIEKISKGEYE